MTGNGSNAGPARAPEVSYIVLSYNYERYIGQTLRSILDQSHADFEVVVVDDGSRDRSCDVVEAIDDPRIRLVRNPTNLGGAGAYNVAVGAARGTWLSNLDADDWIDPRKTERQLARLARDPELAVLGTYCHFVDETGAPLADADLYAAEVNAPRDWNAPDTWIGRNPLCRSSTMVRRDAHMAVGLDDEAMIRAPDYELWTRFLAHGYRLDVLAEPLTHYRLHTRNVTYGDPLGTYLEMCWAALRNLRRAIEADDAWASFDRMVGWVATQPGFADVDARARERLLGLFLDDGSPERRPADYTAFRKVLERPDPALERLGRRVLGMVAQHPPFLDVPTRKRRRGLRKLVHRLKHGRAKHERETL